MQTPYFKAFFLSFNYPFLTIPNVISSAPRYDRFDTSPNIKFLYVKPSNLTKHKIKAKFRAKQSETAEI